MQLMYFMTLNSTICVYIWVCVFEVEQSGVIELGENNSEKICHKSTVHFGLPLNFFMITHTAFPRNTPCIVRPFLISSSSQHDKPTVGCHSHHYIVLHNHLQLSWHYDSINQVWKVWDHGTAIIALSECLWWVISFSYVFSYGVHKPL